jgi:hypothetical protein
VQHQTGNVARTIAHEFHAVAGKALLLETQIRQRHQLANRLQRSGFWKGQGKNAVRAQPHLYK